MANSKKLLGILFALVALQVHAKEGTCEAHAAFHFPVQRGTSSVLDGQAAFLLGSGGTASVYRRNKESRAELVKTYLMPEVRDADLRRAEVWKDVARLIKLNFLRVMSGTPSESDRMIYPDLEGRDLGSLLEWPGLPDAERRLLLKQYDLLKKALRALSEGKLSNPDDPSTMVPKVAWSHNEEGSRGAGYLILYYDDFASGTLKEEQIQIKPSNIIVDADYNFVILDPN